MNLKPHTHLILCVLELSARAVEHMDAGRKAQAVECSTCADIIEAKLPPGWLAEWELSQEQVKKVGKK